jgi:pentatricopeptide repeat protein
MMDKERVAPNLFCYQVVIGICARNGYLTQAFDLYREVIIIFLCQYVELCI